MSIKELVARLKETVARLGVDSDALQTNANELNALVGNPGAVVAARYSTLPIHELYKIFRDYVEHEDTLVNNRLLWNINIQGFLFATYGFTIQKLAEVQAIRNQEIVVGTGTVAMRCLIVFLPVLGISISYLSWKGVKAAQNAIARLEGEWDAVQSRWAARACRVSPEEARMPIIKKGSWLRGISLGFSWLAGLPCSRVTSFPG